jgi:hypothetical protein
VVKRQGEELVKYLERSIAETEKYIVNYPDPEDGSVLYTMGVTELGL